MSIVLGNVFLGVRQKLHYLVLSDNLKIYLTVISSTEMGIINSTRVP